MPLNLKSVANGSVILTPASTAVDKNITLPATDGTMVVQDGTSTTTVTNLAATNITASGTVNVGGGNISPQTGFKNRIINGGMTIDQRNGGASVTPTVTGTYVIDRFRCALSQSSKYSVQQVSAAGSPVGFTKLMAITSLSAYSVLSSDFFSIQQRIEGNNVSDLYWGTANARPVTLSFWAYSSQGGTFGGSLSNNNGDRSYPFTYALSAATWTYTTITVPGDTTGTWATDSNTGIQVSFGLGVGSTFSGTAGAWAAGNFASATGATSVVGTNGATFYLTGVQLEKGSTATPFEFRSIGTELALCQRYYEKGTQRFRIDPFPTAAIGSVYFAATKRATPTITGTAVLGTLSLSGSDDVNTAFFNFTAGASGNASNTFTASAEL